MYEILKNDDSFVVVFTAMMKYAVAVAWENNLNIPQARVTDVVEDILSSEYVPCR